MKKLTEKATKNKLTLLQSKQEMQETVFTRDNHQLNKIGVHLYFVFLFLLYFTLSLFVLSASRWLNVDEGSTLEWMYRRDFMEVTSISLWEKEHSQSGPSLNTYTSR
jgi:hypothetical protein